MSDAQIIAMLVQIDRLTRQNYPFTGLPLWGPNERMAELVSVVRENVKPVTK